MPPTHKGSHPAECGPIADYRRTGNHPHLEQLDYAHIRLNRRPELTNTGRLVLADLCIDLAMASGTTTHTDDAREHLTAAIDDIEAIEDPDLFGKEAHTLVAAHLRRSELPAWTAACQGEPLALQYDEVLEASREVADLGKYSFEASSRVVQYIPVLLGLRGLTLQRPLGWLGRMSLHREAASPFSLKKGDKPRTNWNVGISQPTEPDQVRFDIGDLISPPVKLHVSQKGDRRRYRPQRYEQAGIAVINSIRAGFDDARQIIASCVQEHMGGEHFGSEETPLSSMQLDDITASVATAIQTSQGRIKMLQIK